MINLFLQTVMIGTATAILLSARPYLKILKRIHLERKPFNCSVCLALWISLPVLYFYFEQPIAETIIGALAAGFISDTVHKTLNTY